MSNIRDRMKLEFYQQPFIQTSVSLASVLLEEEEESEELFFLRLFVSSVSSPSIAVDYSVRISRCHSK